MKLKLGLKQASDYVFVSREERDKIDNPYAYITSDGKEFVVNEYEESGQWDFPVALVIAAWDEISSLEGDFAVVTMIPFER